MAQATATRFKVPDRIKQAPVFVYEKGAYYGWAAHGSRIHLGVDILFEIHKGKKRVYRLEAFCGVDVYAFQNGSMPPAGYAAYFCRNCFRRAAWHAFLERMKTK
jgi:hypothetical protein